MNVKRLAIIAGAALVVGGFLVGGAAFAQGQPQEQPPAAVTPDQARAAALAAVTGTVLDVELEDEGGRAAYEVVIRPRDGGRVVEVLVDGSTGAVLTTEADDDDGPSADIGDLFDDDDR
ncbi:MAG: PepSY domain-containing protein [Chloroflexota bacterium]